MMRTSLPLLALGLAACQHPMAEPIGNFGDAVQHNMAMQIIDPEPLLDPPPPEMQGDRAALAFARYQWDSAGRIQGPGPDRSDIEDVGKQVGLPEQSIIKIEGE